MYRIVIVDNDKTQLGVLKKLVSKAPGCQPQAFSDAMEALTWCRENEPDVVIVDYALEGMNGLQFLRAFRAMYSRDAVPMLIMTAAGDSQVRFEALKDGANDYLTKPFDNLEFSVRTRNQLTARQYHRTMLERNAWLGGGEPPALPAPAPGRLAARLVSPRVNSPANDDAACLEAPAPPAQGSLFWNDRCSRAVAMVQWAPLFSDARSSQATGIETPSPGRARAENAAAVVAPWVLRR